MYRCLIVEDDPQVAKLNATYLAQEGFLVSAVAADASQALVAMEEQTFDLVLLDVFLPGMNGLELLRRLRATTADIRGHHHLCCARQRTDLRGAEAWLRGLYH